MGNILIEVTESIDATVDTVNIVVNISNKDDNDLCSSYEEASKIGSGHMSEVMSILKNFGIQNDNIKASRLSVRPVHTTVNTRKETVGSNFFSRETENTYSRRLLGYGYTTAIRVELPSNVDYLAKLYCKLSSEENVKSVDVSFSIKDDSEWKDKLLEKLIDKAKHQAKILARAAGIENISIDKIIKEESHSGYRSSMLCCSGFDDSYDYEDEEVYEENIEEILSINMDKPIIFTDSIKVYFC